MGTNYKGKRNMVSSSPLRLLRLIRIARLSRLLKGMPELVFVLKGLVEGSRSVTVTLLMLVVILYVFAIVFVLISKDSELEQEYFRSVSSAMYALFIHVVLMDDLATFFAFVEEQSLLCFALLFLVLVT